MWSWQTWPRVARTTRTGGAELLIATGLRIGEAVALEWGDIDLDALTLRVSRSWKLGGTVGTPKTDRARVVHIDPDTAATLERHRRSRDRTSAHGT
jgi:integrase